MSAGFRGRAPLDLTSRPTRYLPNPNTAQPRDSAFDSATRNPGRNSEANLSLMGSVVTKHILDFPNHLCFSRANSQTAVYLSRLLTCTWPFSRSLGSRTPGHHPLPGLSSPHGPSSSSYSYTCSFCLFLRLLFCLFLKKKKKRRRALKIISDLQRSVAQQCKYT